MRESVDSMWYVEAEGRIIAEVMPGNPGEAEENAQLIEGGQAMSGFEEWWLYKSPLYKPKDIEELELYAKAAYNAGVAAERERCARLAAPHGGERAVDSGYNSRRIGAENDSH